ncbi:zinc finger protein 728 [Folsomia candida]|nr:zinc finger protein 728 [Folsomia candida]
MHEADPFPYQCSSCPKKFKIAKSLRIHLSHPCHSGDGAPPPKPLPCPLCLKKFSSDSSLERHTANLHPLHSCTFCSLAFPSPEETVTHELLHQNSDQPFACTTCPGAAFPNSARLKEHVAVAHLNKFSICDFCGLKFKSVTGLKKHQKLHDESFVGCRCDVCGATFVTKSTLATHMFKHVTDKGFTCEICGKGFIHPASLKRHRIGHEERLPIECKICGKRFATKQFLLVHEETHSGTLSNECDVCGKKFQTRQGRRRTWWECTDRRGQRRGGEGEGIR